MKISLELEQGWSTAKEALDYFRLLSRTMERIFEMEADAPTDWFILIEKVGEANTVSLTHL